MAKLSFLHRRALLWRFVSRHYVSRAGVRIVHRRGWARSFLMRGFWLGVGTGASVMGVVALGVFMLLQPPLPSPTDVGGSVSATVDVEAKAQKGDDEKIHGTVRDLKEDDMIDLPRRKESVATSSSAAPLTGEPYDIVLPVRATDVADKPAEKTATDKDASGDRAETVTEASPVKAPSLVATLKDQAPTAQSLPPQPDSSVGHGKNREVRPEGGGNATTPAPVPLPAVKPIVERKTVPSLSPAEAKGKVQDKKSVIINTDQAKGDDAFAKGNYAAAVDHYRSALKSLTHDRQGSESVKAAIERPMALALAALRQGEEALPLLRAWLSAKPDDRDVLHSLADLLADEGSPEAMDELALLLNRHSDDAALETAMGNLKSQNGDLGGALPYYEKAHNLAPSVLIYQANLANAYDQSGRTATALTLYQDILRRAISDKGQAGKGIPLTQINSRIKQLMAETVP